VPSGSETVLVVEDSPSVRAVAVNILKRHGYNMLEATSSRHAIDISDSYKKSIDLLLTDVVMPELNGRVLAEELLRKRPAMGVLFMSGYADDAVMRHGVLPAGTLHLQKPFTPGALALKVREVLDARPPKSDAASVRRRPAPRAKKKRKKE
jgi:CheY-like chemotaxis protein